MTEEEWLSATDPECLIYYLESHAPVRKLRLLAASGCRRIWGLLFDQATRQAVEVVERLADRGSIPDEIGRTRNETAIEESSLQANDQHASDAAATALMEEIKFYIVADSMCPVRTSERRARIAPHLPILRDIFGNPFRPATFDPIWRSSTIENLAAAIYEERHLPSGLFNNQRLGVLADALEDVGCDNSEILGHLRRGDEHVRGCWAVDLILSKD